MNEFLENGVEARYDVGARFISPSPYVDNSATCELDAEGHCITCSDEALTARVLRVDELLGFASVTIEDAQDEVDITLLDEVAEGDLILVHGGIAIANMGKNSASDEAGNA